MEEMLQHIRRIQDKLQGLQKQFQQVTRDRDRMGQEIQSFQEKDQLQQHRIEQLEKQLEMNRAIRPERNDTDKKALEKRINQYLREIDKCIALLNE
jgi:chromosome segregation ATPase